MDLRSTGMHKFKRQCLSHGFVTRGCSVRFDKKPKLVVQLLEIVLKRLSTLRWGRASFGRDRWICIVSILKRLRTFIRYPKTTSIYIRYYYRRCDYPIGQTRGRKSGIILTRTFYGTYEKQNHTECLPLRVTAFFFPLVIPFPFFFSVDTEYDSSPPSLYLQVNFGPSFYTERLSDEFRFYSLNGRKVLYTIVLFKLVQFIFDSSTVDISVVLTAVSEDYVFPPRPQNSSCQYGVISVYATFSTAASYPLAKADR